MLDAALHALISPVRDAEEKYVNLLRFLVLQREGALQLTPEVTYKIKTALLRLTPQGIKPPPARRSPLARAVLAFLWLFCGISARKV